jgi:DNA-binding NarL/FixJ family response regulator
MKRSERLEYALRSIAVPDACEQAERLSILPPPEDRFALAVASIVSSWGSAVTAARAHAVAAWHATDGGDDPAADTAARIAAANVRAVDREAWDLFDGVDPIEEALHDARDLPAELRDGLGILLVDAALASARVGAAVVLLNRIDPDVWTERRATDPFAPFALITAARARAFSGDVAAAAAYTRAARACAQTPLARRVADACSALVAGNADERRYTRQLVRDAQRAEVASDHLAASGTLLLAAYGAIAQNDFALAAELVRRAGVDDELSNLRITDRAIAWEVLVRAALEAHDPDAAHAWHAQAMLFADHPIAESTVARIDARMALAAGDPGQALVCAERAIATAERSGRGIEAAEGEVLAARARLALGQGSAATRRLEDLVGDAHARGHDAVRLAAARELRASGRRLPPPAQSGWEGLSERERAVALLIADGLSNSQIAGRLFLSPHTVRSHVTRILHSFGVASRAGVVAHLRARAASAPSADVVAGEMSRLTARQAEVAALVAEGVSNRGIAERLGISESTVEKHLAALRRHTGATSRAAIALLAESAETP